MEKNKLAFLTHSVLFLLVFLCSFFVFSVKTTAFEDFGEIQDRGVLANMYAINAFQVHYTNWMYYTMNVHTPGFIEQGVYNTRRSASKNPEYVPFYRWRAGPIQETGGKLDFYLDAGSRGFFVIKLPTMIAFTRDGRFMLDSKRRLVTLSGLYPVMGDTGEIVFPEGVKENDITVSRAGMLYAAGEPVARLRIAVFKSFTEMQSMDTLNGSVFVMTREMELLEGEEHYSITQGHLEQNNVLKGITGDILFAKNSYDVNVKSAQLLNRITGTASSLISPTQ